MALTSRQRWAAYAVCGVATLAAIVAAPPPSGDDAPAVAAVAPAVRQAAAPGAAAVPGTLTLPSADRRRFGEAGADPFDTPMWEAPPPPPPAPVDAAAAAAAAAALAPSAPPLPFTYLGKWIENGETIVFLSAGGQDYSARKGAALEGGYVVEAIEESQIVLRYKPLGTLQALPLAAQPGGNASASDTASDSGGGDATEQN
jgi:hypothetical protein